MTAKPPRSISRSRAADSSSRSTLNEIADDLNLRGMSLRAPRRRLCHLLALLQVKFARAQDRQLGDLEKIALARDINVRQAALVELFPDLLRGRFGERQVQDDDALPLLGVGDRGDGDDLLVG